MVMIVPSFCTVVPCIAISRPRSSAATGDAGDRTPIRTVLRDARRTTAVGQSVGLGAGLAAAGADRARLRLPYRYRRRHSAMMKVDRDRQQNRGISAPVS